MHAASDRTDVVQKATQLVNRGDLKGAVRIYARLFQEDARDWSVGNTLGDLYVRLGQADDAISHFTVLAEQLAADGFAAKARALYRKILRIEPANALARQRVDELERQQAGQTSPFLQRVLETARTLRENEAATIPAAPAEPEATRSANPRESPSEAAAPPDETPRRIAQPDSRPLPTVTGAPPAPDAAAPKTAVPDAARMPQTDAEWAEEWAAVMSVAKPESQRPEGAPRAAASAATKAPETEPPPAQTQAPPPPARAPQPAEEGRNAEVTDEFRSMAAEADAAVAQHDYGAAVAIVEDYLTARPYDIAALEKLIDLGVDGTLGTQLVVAQVRLAEACLRAERYTQAYYAVLDLIARHPESESHRALLERVRTVAREHGRTFPPLPTMDADIRPVLEPEAPPPAPPAVAPAQARPPVRILRPDFTDAPRAGRSKPESSPAEKHEAPPAASGVLADLLADLGDPDTAFEEIRDALLEEAAAAAEERFAEATRHIEAHRFDEAARALEEAMCAPHLRAPAGSRLAQIYREQGAAMEALTCLEWVAEIPPSSEESGHELAYELALTLEALGQHAQALGLYRELLAEVGPGYRDVDARAQRLAVA